MLCCEQRQQDRELFALRYIIIITKSRTNQLAFNVRAVKFNFNSIINARRLFDVYFRKLLNRSMASLYLLCTHGAAHSAHTHAHTICSKFEFQWCCYIGVAAAVVVIAIIIMDKIEFYGKIFEIHKR